MGGLTGVLGAELVVHEHDIMGKEAGGDDDIGKGNLVVHEVGLAGQLAVQDVHQVVEGALGLQADGAQERI